MNYSRTEIRILMKMEALIFRSCIPESGSEDYQELHKELIKRHYKASDVNIDYQGKIVHLTFSKSSPETSNHTSITALRFSVLSDFLLSCLNKDRDSMVFYMSILHSYSPDEASLMVV